MQQGRSVNLIIGLTNQLLFPSDECNTSSNGSLIKKYLSDTTNVQFRAGEMRFYFSESCSFNNQHHVIMLELQCYIAVFHQSDYYNQVTTRFYTFSLTVCFNDHIYFQLEIRCCLVFLPTFKQLRPKFGSLIKI